MEIELDLNMLDILMQIPNIGSQGSHHVSGDNQHNSSSIKLGMGLNNPIIPGITNPVNIKVVREGGWEEQLVDRPPSPGQGSMDPNLGDQLKEIAATLEVLQHKV